jgi:hypothetical protein
MEEKKSSRSLQKGLTVIPSATAMTRFNKTGIDIFAYGGSGTYWKTITSGAGIVDMRSGSIVPDPTYDRVDNSKICVKVTDSEGAEVDVLLELGQPIDVVASILLKEMNFTSDQIILWNQGIITPPEAPIYLVLSIPSTTVISKTAQYRDEGVFLKRVDAISMLDVVHVDIISRTSEALIRKMDPLQALTSEYAQQQQLSNVFKLSITTRDVMNTIDLQPSYSPYRFRHAFIMHSTVEYVSNVPYYNKAGEITVKVGD